MENITTSHLIPTIFETSHLHLITPEPLWITACVGGPRAGLAYAEKTFAGYVDPNFKNWQLDTEQPTTKATPVLVYEQHKDDKPMNIFNSFELATRDLIFNSQEQIERFAIEHPLSLNQHGDGTFSLFHKQLRGKDEFFFSCMYLNDYKGLGIAVDKLLLNNQILRASRQHRFIVPAVGLLVRS